MNKLDVKRTEMVEMEREDARTVTGGDDTTSYVKCVSATLTNGGGAVRPFVLGYGIFGLARLCGVIAGRLGL